MKDVRMHRSFSDQIKWFGLFRTASSPYISEVDFVGRCIISERKITFSIHNRVYACTKAGYAQTQPPILPHTSAVWALESSNKRKGVTKQLRKMVERKVLKEAAGERSREIFDGS